MPAFAAVAGSARSLREVHAEACAHAGTKPPNQYSSGPFEPFARPRSAILTADFNMRATESAYAQLLVPFDDGAPRFVNAWTHAHQGAAHPPTFCIHDKEYAKEPYACDFVFVTEDLLPRLKSVRVDVETQASDHQPVIVELA